MDVTPLIPKGKKIINGYGNGGFTITHEKFQGSQIILPNNRISWGITDPDYISVKSLTDIFKHADEIELLLIGSGNQIAFLEPDISKKCKENGIAVEIMSTGAACRTYNVLLSEDRKVAAALIAVQ